MASRIRSFDWASTPLGPIARWPQSLKTIVDLMLRSKSIMSLVWGPEAIHLYNDSFMDLLHEHRTLSLGRSAFETFARSRDIFEADLAAGMAGTSARLLGQRYPVLRDGRLQDAWFDVDYAPICDEDGSVAGVLWTLKETTAQLLAEQALRTSEARHRLLIETWAQAMWETDADGVVVTDSPSWRAYTGQTREERLGYGWLDAVHPDDRAYAERQWRETVAARGLVDAEFRLRAPDGRWRWTNVRVAPVLDRAGKVEKWVGMNMDVTDRKRAEAALRESEKKYRSLFEMMGTGFVLNELVRDKDGTAIDVRYLDLNPASEKLVGWKAEDTVGRLMSEKITADETARWVADFEAIINSGETMQSEHYHESLDMWFRANTSPIGGDRIALVYQNNTAEKRADLARRENEERQAFLLDLSDALRPLSDAGDIQSTTTRLLGAYLSADRVMYAEVTGEPGTETGVIRGQFVRPAAPGRPAPVPFPEHFTYAIFGARVMARRYSGEGLAVSDVNSDLDFDATERSAWARVGVQAAIVAPLVKGGRLVAELGVHSETPRAWTHAEVSLVRELGERTWAAAERARAEAASRASEERFQQFARASAAGLWIRAADTLTMEFVSSAIGANYGVEAEALLGDVQRWAALIVPEDRDLALQHLQEARDGKTVVHEFRIHRQSDGSFRWIRNTDFPLRDDGHIPRIGGIAEDITEAKLAVEHQGVLLAELQHRVRNIMGMIRSMANRTAGGARDVADYRSLLEGRLLALARVQALLTREANVGGSLRAVVDDEIAAQAHHRHQFELIGPDVSLSPKAVEVLTLAFHELATNALKYGALSVPDGHLAVTWTLLEKRGRPRLTLDWTETGAPARAPSTRRGFGSELIEARIPYELGGRGAITIKPEGAHCHLEFPLRDGESILETDAPRPTTVFGGALDMTGSSDLTGRTVLVVEDDYYLASDTAAALRGAGAAVLGPCPSAEDARELIADEVPTCAVLDLNLGGGGPRFEMARLLKSRGIPFVFLTGYDPDVLPPDLRDVGRLQKPLPYHAIVEAVGQL